MAENKSFLDSIAESKKPNSFDKESFVAVNNTQKMKGVVITFVILVLAVIAIFLFYTQFQKVKVVALVGQNITDASLWAKTNDVSIVTKNSYDFTIAEGIILEQSLQEGETIKKKDTLTLQVSVGPDPEEALDFPDIMSMNGDEIDSWIAQNKLTGVKISTKSSNIIAEDQVIEFSFTDGDEDGFLRKNRVEIVLSSGPATEGETVVVTDFTVMKAGKILQWGLENNITINIEEAYNKYFAEGEVISQSIKSGNEILKGETITVILSLGETDTVPDFSTMNVGKILQWGAYYGVEIYVEEEFNKNFLEGTVIAQSVKAGEDIANSGPITVTVSLGNSETVPDFSTLNVGKILQWGADHDIKIRVEEEFNQYFLEGTIISQSVKAGAEILKSVPITVYVSLGKAETVPDFTTMNAGKILQWGADNGIKIRIEEEFNKYYANGTVISQSIKTDSKLSSTETITVHISLGEPVVVPDFSTQTKEESSAWAKATGVTLITFEHYNSDIQKGKLISQDLSKGYHMRIGEEITLIYSLGKVEVSSYIGKTKLDILAWQADVNSKGANISLKFTESYGNKNTVGQIIEQSIKNNQVNTETTIEVTISKGAIVRVPDFSGLSETECVTLANSLGLNITYEYTTSTTVDEGYLIRQAPSKSSLIADSEKITLTFSLSEVITNTVKVPDFSSMKSSEILKWGTDNDVHTVLFEENSNFVSSGGFVSQSVKVDTVINKGSYIYIGISIGKATQTNYTIVPDFSVLSDSEASAWAKSAGVNLAVVALYSDTYPKGLYYAQSIAKEVPIAEGKGITVTQSLGKVSITSFVGKTKLDVLNWQQEVNSKGANITISFTNSDGLGGTSGIVKSQSIMNDYISLNETIIIDLE